jgi:hypothetical protein
LTYGLIMTDVAHMHDQISVKHFFPVLPNAATSSAGGQRNQRCRDMIISSPDGNRILRIVGSSVANNMSLL